MYGTTLNPTVRELIDTSPAAAEVLMELGIDPAQHMDESLGELCERVELEPHHVLEVILVADVPLEEYSGPPLDPQSAGLRDLIEHLVSHHHQYLRRQLPRLQLLVHKAQRDATATYRDRLNRLQQLLTELRGLFDAHMIIQEQVLFPRIMELAQALDGQGGFGGHLSEPLEEVASGYHQAARVFEEMRQVADHYRVPMDAGASHAALLQELSDLEGRTLAHAQIESQFLFPRAVQMQRQLQGG